MSKDSRNFDTLSDRTVIDTQSIKQVNVWQYVKPFIDMALVFASFGTAYWVRYELQWIRQVEPAYLVPFSAYLPSVLALVVIQVLVYWIEGAYRLDREKTLLDELYIVLRGTLTAIAAMIVIVFLATPSYHSRLIFGYTGIIILLSVGGARAIERYVITQRHKRGLGVSRLLIVGAGEIGRSIMRTVVARPELGYQIVGFVDDDPRRAGTDIGRYPALGTTDTLPSVMDTHDVDQVIITLPWISHRKILDIMRECARDNVHVRIVPDLFQMTLSRVVVEQLDGIPLLGIREPSLHRWQALFKRAMDLGMASLGLIISSPLMLAVAIAIRLDSPGPIIFKQARLGRNQRKFTCLKFRSMHLGAESQLEKLREENESTGPIFKMRDDPRQTRVGRILRRTSLDELPQLWNVLKGEMSIIGPRPPIPSEVKGYESWHLRRLEVRPGITGLWQVSGRSDLTFDEMVLLDIYYIENWSPLLDLRILLKTIPTVILSKGAY
ncbi:MAG: undecaprenyl-phosphate glucose phosphotransferase [Chloroflexota bacterium]|nr:undecaprenyl-phosphate glucose phosphotransferase [Chloroflexota bacterium]